MSRVVPLGRWFVSTSILTGLLFLCAGTTHAPMLKAYLAVFAGAGLATAVLNDPSLDRERRQPGPAEIYRGSRMAASGLFLATLIVAALDVGRFHWIQPVSELTQIVGLSVLILAASLQVLAMAANPFFSPAIRTQLERGHQVMDAGPYRFIRHPGYLAMIIIMPATALVIGSIAAIIPGLGYAGLILWRTKREDQFLTEQLPGYAAYSSRVCYRLIPVLW